MWRQFPHGIAFKEQNDFIGLQNISTRLCEVEIFRSAHRLMTHSAEMSAHIVHDRPTGAVFILVDPHFFEWQLFKANLPSR